MRRQHCNAIADAALFTNKYRAEGLLCCATATMIWPQKLPVGMYLSVSFDLLCLLHLLPLSLTFITYVNTRRV